MFKSWSTDPSKILSTGTIPDQKIISPTYWDANISIINAKPFLREREIKFMSVYKDLDRIRQLSEGWNIYGAPVPAPNAISAVSSIIDISYGKDFRPLRVDPSVEGGVAIVFAADDIYADIECLNTGEILAGTRDQYGIPHIWETNLKNIKNDLEKIRSFIDDNATSKNADWI